MTTCYHVGDKCHISDDDIEWKTRRKRQKTESSLSNFVDFKQSNEDGIWKLHDYQFMHTIRRSESDLKRSIEEENEKLKREAKLLRCRLKWKTLEQQLTLLGCPRQNIKNELGIETELEKAEPIEPLVTKSSQETTTNKMRTRFERDVAQLHKIMQIGMDGEPFERKPSDENSVEVIKFLLKRILPDIRKYVETPWKENEQNLKRKLESERIRNEDLKREIEYWMAWATDSNYYRC